MNNDEKITKNEEKIIDKYYRIALENINERNKYEKMNEEEKKKYIKTIKDNIKNKEDQYEVI